MNKASQQFIRKAGLIVYEGDSEFYGDLPIGEFVRRGIDLSEMRFTFNICNADVSSPNHAAVRIYNLSRETLRKIRATQFARVVISGGYEDSFGVIFHGDIKQYQFGRLSATDTFLDIMAADGDIGFNFGVVNYVFGPGSNAEDHVRKGIEAMGLDVGRIPDLTGTSPRLARGKVGYGMARDLLNTTARTLGASWSIQQGDVFITPLKEYLPGTELVLNATTGMIGIPEQTDQGINVRCLLNPKIRIGQLIRINNRDIIQLVQANGAAYGVPFNQWAGIQFAAKIADETDGLYRAYVVEHNGDTRGHNWYSDLVLLGVSVADKRVEANS